MNDRPVTAERSRVLSGVMRRPALAVHGGLLAVVTLIGVMPHAGGNMLIVPLLPSHPGIVLQWALPTGALAIGSGPLPGSVLVKGSRSALWIAALAHGAVILNGGASGCFDRKEQENG